MRKGKCCSSQTVAGNGRAGQIPGRGSRCVHQRLPFLAMSGRENGTTTSMNPGLARPEGFADMVAGVSMVQYVPAPYLMSQMWGHGRAGVLSPAVPAVLQFAIRCWTCSSRSRMQQVYLTNACLSRHFQTKRALWMLGKRLEGGTQVIEKKLERWVIFPCPIKVHCFDDSLSVF